jgi:uncharacterized membrane-anchored protein
MTARLPLGNAASGRTVIAKLTNGSPWTRRLLNKVPEVTILFWIVKILSTTVGETAADFLSVDLGLGLSATTAVMSLLLVAMLMWQLATRHYVPGIYWLTVVLASVVGTLLCDNLVDNLGLWTTTAMFGAALAVAFAGWYCSEHTMSIHTVFTRRREAWYWCAILCAFSLGTAGGDLVSEKLALGYLTAGVVFGGVIALIAAAHDRRMVRAVGAFWAAYVTTRPLGGSIGNFLTATPKDGGLGLGTNTTSAIFLVLILVIVGWFTADTHRSRRELPDAHA